MAILHSLYTFDARQHEPHCNPYPAVSNPSFIAPPVSCSSRGRQLAMDPKPLRTEQADRQVWLVKVPVACMHIRTSLMIICTGASQRGSQVAGGMPTDRRRWRGTRPRAGQGAVCTRQRGMHVKLRISAPCRTRSPQDTPQSMLLTGVDTEHGHVVFASHSHPRPADGRPARQGVYHAGSR